MNKVNNHSNHKKNKPRAQKVQQIDLLNCSIQQLLEKAIQAYRAHDVGSQDRWNTMLAKSGTKKDKISAAGVLILQNPQSCLKYVDMLIKWCFDKNHNFAISACQGMANIFSDHLLTAKTSLKDFAESVQSRIRQNNKNTKVLASDLVAYYLQSELKQYYSEFIKAIQVLLNDDLNHIKKSCIKMLGNLARFKELRRTILSLIINKLGDTDMDVVNQVSKCLKDQFYQDILASQILMEETERFLFRTNLPHKAQFFVINFLNNINLKFLNEKSLQKLFEIFYHFFTKCISSQQKSDELASRLFLNSIKGLNRVFSFMKGGSKQTKKIIQQKIEDVYKIVHTTPNIKAKIQLLLFLFQSHAHLHGNISSNGRFYRTLYDFIGKDEIIHSSLSQMFFDLVLVCMKQDENLNRVLAMSKRMLQLCFGANSNFIITTLLMLDKVLQSNDGFRIFITKQQNAMTEQSDLTQKYDANKRDPLFAGAQKTCLWQLKALCAHFHPTVRKFAKSIISGQQIQYTGSNPLLQFNLTSFIQKMSLRKQKKSQAWKIKVKRNLPKIRSSKYETLLDKQLTDFKQDQQYIKKYLERRNNIHTNKKKMQTNDIQEFADNVIQKQMDRLNPKEADEQLSITPIGSDQQDLGSWDEENQQQFNQQNPQQDEQFNEDENMDEDGQFNEQVEDDDMQMEDDFDEENSQGMEEKQFQDVFNQIQNEDSYEGKGAKNNKGRKFDKKTKNIGKKIKNKFNKFNKGNKGNKGNKNRKPNKNSKKR